MAKAKKSGDAPTDTTSNESASPKAAGEKPVKKRTPKNKTQAVKRALRRIGWEAKPVELHDWVWNHYRIDIDKGHISTIKSSLARQKREEEGEQPASLPAPSHAEKVQTNGPGSLSIAELRIVKDLVSRIGRERFRDLADLFSS